MTDHAETGLTEMHTVLCVDDEENILFALKRVFRKEPYELLTTTGAAEALTLLENRPVDLIISDHRMPEMEGTELLERARRIKPDAARIMLTGYADLDAAVDAINRCGVYRFIAKPWNDEDLRLTVRQALRQGELVALNRELAELLKVHNLELYEINRSLEGAMRARTRELDEKTKSLSEVTRKLESGVVATIHAFVGLMELKSPALAAHARRVSRLAAQAAAAMQLSDQDCKLCETGALLMDVGAIGYPDELLKKRESDMDNLARTLWQKHPLLGEAALRDIEQLRSVAQVIRAHHERMDGNGFPDGLTGDAIPLAARVVAVCNEFVELVAPRDPAHRMPASKAIERLSRERGRRFDPAVTDAVVAMAAEQSVWLEAG